MSGLFKISGIAGLAEKWWRTLPCS